MGGGVEKASEGGGGERRQPPTLLHQTALTTLAACPTALADASPSVTTLLTALHAVVTDGDAPPLDTSGAAAALAAAAAAGDALATAATTTTPPMPLLDAACQTVHALTTAAAAAPPPGGVGVGAALAAALHAAPRVLAGVRAASFSGTWHGACGGDDAPMATGAAALRAAVKDGVVAALCARINAWRGSQPAADDAGAAAVAACMPPIVARLTGTAGAAVAALAGAVAAPPAARSFALINATAGGAARLLTEVDEGGMKDCIDAAASASLRTAAADAVTALAAPLARAAADAVARPTEASAVPIRFWAQHVARVAAAHPAAARSAFGRAAPPVVEAAAALTPVDAPQLTAAKAAIDRALVSLIGDGAPDAADLDVATATQALRAAGATASPPTAAAVVAALLVPALRAGVKCGMLACDSVARDALASAAAAAVATAVRGDARAWAVAETALFDAAMLPAPAARDVLATAWTVVLTAAPGVLAAAHATVLTRAAAGAAALADGRPPSVVAALASHLTLLAGRLLAAAPPDATTRLLQDVAASLDLGDGGRGAAAAAAAARAAAVAAPPGPGPRTAAAALLDAAMAAARDAVITRDGDSLAGALAVVEGLLARGRTVDDALLPRATVDRVASVVAGWLPPPPASAPPCVTAAVLRVAGAAGWPRGATVALLTAARAAAPHAPAVAAAATPLAPAAAADGGRVDALFGVLLTPPHWLGRHCAVEALVTHARAGGDDVLACVPRSVHDPAKDGEGGAFMELVRAVMMKGGSGGGGGSSAASVDGAVVTVDAAAVAAAIAEAVAVVVEASTSTPSASDRLRDAAAALADVEATLAAGGRGIDAATLAAVAEAADRIKRRCVGA